MNDTYTPTSRAGRLLAELDEGRVYSAYLAKPANLLTTKRPDVKKNKRLARDVIKSVEHALNHHELNAPLAKYKSKVATAVGLIIDTMDDGEIGLGTFFDTTKTLLTKAGRPFRLV